MNLEILFGEEYENMRLRRKGILGREENKKGK